VGTAGAARLRRYGFGISEEDRARVFSGLQQLGIELAYLDMTALAACAVGFVPACGLAVDILGLYYLAMDYFPGRRHLRIASATCITVMAAVTVLYIFAVWRSRGVFSGVLSLFYLGAPALSLSFYSATFPSHVSGQPTIPAGVSWGPTGSDEFSFAF
jgi:hypothetical protein